LHGRQVCGQRQESSAEEFDTGSPVHLPFEHFQTIGLTLDGPLLHRVVTAASTARMSRRKRHTKFWINAMPVACARSNHWCRATVVRAFSVGVVGCRKSDRKPNIKGRITA
jgi:hypothetical protein